GVNDPVTALVAAIEGLHTEDRQDDLRLDPIDLFRPRERVGVLVPEGDAVLDALVDDENLAVLMPWAHPLGGAGNGLKDGFLALSLLQQAPYMLGIEAVFPAHLLDEGVYPGVFCGIGPSGQKPGAEPGDEQGSQRIAAQPA